MMSQRRKYFTPAMDICMLQECLHVNPWSHKGLWSSIARNLTSLPDFNDIDSRSARDRVANLLQAFRRESMHSLKRSGTEEEYEERERLLQEVNDMECEWRERDTKRPLDGAPVIQRTKKARVFAERGVECIQPSVSFYPDTYDEVQSLTTTGSDPPSLKSEPVEENEFVLTEPLMALQNEHAKYSLGPSGRLDTIIQFLQDNEERKVQAGKQELEIKRLKWETRKLEAENEKKRLEMEREERMKRLELEEKKTQDAMEERKKLLVLLEATMKKLS